MENYNNGSYTINPVIIPFIETLLKEKEEEIERLRKTLDLRRYFWFAETSNEDFESICQHINYNWVKDINGVYIDMELKISQAYEKWKEEDITKIIWQSEKDLKKELTDNEFSDIRDYIKDSEFTMARDAINEIIIDRYKKWKEEVISEAEQIVEYEKGNWDYEDGEREVKEACKTKSHLATWYKILAETQLPNYWSELFILENPDTKFPMRYVNQFLYDPKDGYDKEFEELEESLFI